MSIQLKDPTAITTERLTKLESEHGELMDTKAAAELLHISQRTLDNWRTRNRGPRYLKIGHKIFYGAKDVEAFLDRGVEVVGTVDSQQINGEGEAA